MGAHAFFAPSSAPRVVECPGSVLLTHGMPDTQTYDAAHGTAAHWVADLCLRNNKHVETYTGCVVAVTETGDCCFEHEKNRESNAALVEEGKMFTFEVDDEMAAAVQEYVDWCNETPGEHHPECRVDISKWCPKDASNDNVFLPAQAFEPQKGTSDHAACEPGRLIITDLKYGKGVKVYAENNYQAVLYALGFIDEWNFVYDFKEIEIRICQPRLDHKDVWIISFDEIMEIGDYIRERFALSLQIDAPFSPSEKACRFCKASGLCKAQEEFLSKVTALQFDNLDWIDEHLLTTEQLVEAYELQGFVKQRLEAIKRHMFRLIAEGTLPGMKLVEGRTFRAWRNEDMAMGDLELQGVPAEKLYAQSAISPAKAEKLLPKSKRGIIETLAFKPRGKPVIARADDKRPAFEGLVAQDLANIFDDLDEMENE